MKRILERILTLTRWTRYGSIGSSIPVQGYPVGSIGSGIPGPAYRVRATRLGLSVQGYRVHRVSVKILFIPLLHRSITHFLYVKNMLLETPQINNTLFRR